MSEVLHWLEEIKSAKKREKTYRDEGEDLLKIYEGEKTPFNILYSNTETLLPALFSNIPRPVISRRHKDVDPFGKMASEMCQRGLEYLLDTDIDSYEKFGEAIENAVFDGLLPGRGVTSIKYDANDDATWETACTETRDWKRVYFGYAKRWSKVPWVAYEEELDKEEATRLFGRKANDVIYKEGEEEDENTEDKGKRKTATFYQIWCKKDKQIKYICAQYKDGYLRVDDDPLELSGFFNCPKPIQFVKQTGGLTPISLYSLYEVQAKELNRIQYRINKVVEAIKVRGLFNGSFSIELENLFKEDDNALVPTEKIDVLSEGGFDRAIWMIPIEKIIVVLQQLYQAREACKAVIYEITGISDIIRGQSRASETLGAQEIKQTWGVMRIKRHQKEVQRYVLDSMKLLLEIAITKFSEDTWKKITMLNLPTSAEKDRMIRLYEAQKVEYDRQVQAGVQAKPPEPVTMPSFGEILEVLKDDFARSYRLDIETNSTLDIEATEDKQNISEFMNAMAQFMNGIGTMQDIPFEAKKSMLLAITKRFRFGREVEDELSSMQQPQPQVPPQIQQQIQQAQQTIKKSQEQLKKAEQVLEKERAKLESDRTEAERVVERRLNDIKERELQLDYDKRVAKIELDNEQKIGVIEQNADQKEAESSLKQMLTVHESRIQSIVDKATAKIDNKGTTVVMPENKSIKLIREDGILTGAEVE